MDTLIIPLKRLKKKKPCPSCGTAIDMASVSCRPCRDRIRRENKKASMVCIECGGMVGAERSKRCSACKGKPRRIPDAKYREIARSRGFIWVGQQVKTSATRTAWQCSKGHVWMATYRAIKNGIGCSQCNGYQADDYINLAKDRGILWVGHLPNRIKEKTEWQCPNNHVWKCSYNSIKQGTRCPQCKKIQAEDCHALAERCGFTWIGDLPSRIDTQTEWQCKNGHRWFADLHSIKRGSGCQQCRKIQPEAYHALAIKRGFLWLGRIIEDSHTKTEWQCENGHKWKAPYNVIKQGHGCPLCDNRVNGTKSSKPQQALAEMVGGIQNHRIGRYVIDVALFLPLANLAIEYDAYYWHKDNQHHDSKKTTHLLGKGWKVLRIKSSKMLPTFDQIQGCIFDLLAGADYAEIVMPDWGKGKAR